MPRTVIRGTFCCSLRIRRSASSSPSNLSIWRSGFRRPCIMLSDLDIGMNDWVTPAPEVGRCLPSRSGSCADRRGAGARRQVFPLFALGRELCGGAHAPRRGREGGLFHSRLRAQQAGRRTPRCRTNTGRSWIGWRGSTRPPRAFVPQPEIRRRRRARASVWSGSAAAIRRCGRRWTSSQLGACPPTTCAFAAFPFDERVEAFLLEHEICFVVEQNRDAQLKSLLTLETSVPKEQLRSVLVYGGFPLSARHVVEGVWPRGRAHGRPPDERTRRLTMPSITKPIATHPSLAAQRAGADHSRL